MSLHPAHGNPPSPEDFFRAGASHRFHNGGMTSPPKIALIEDDKPTSAQLAAWIRAARPDIQIDCWFNRDEAEAALQRETYDVVLLDIELGHERHAGVALINAINKHRPGTPVLVISAMPAAIYRSIMKALDAWDYLQKTTFEERDFIETFLEILRAALKNTAPSAAKSVAPTAKALDDLSLDPLWQRTPTWRGQRVNLPLTAQRILATLHQRAGEVVSYEELFDVVKSGRSRDNVRKHVSTIREAFKEVDEDFAGIENIPMRGFRWMPSAASSKS
jgi:DNA-binding response OmpR family regulator